MVSISVNDVLDAINVSSSDISDDKVLKMIKRAAVTVGLELDTIVDYSDCSEAEKEAVTVLAAIYAVCFLTGGSSVGLNFHVGDMNTSIASTVPALDVLTNEFERLIGKLKKPYVGTA